jgi:hypothetical protein
MTTANQIVKDAYFSARITDLVDGPDGNQTTHGLRLLNRLIDEFSTEELLIPYRESENFSITSASASYTMGSGGTASSSRAKKILDCYIRDSADIDYPVKIITEKEYNRLADKALSAKPTELFYDPVYPVGVIYFNYTPDTTYTAYIESQKNLHSDLSIATTISLPAEYERFLESALAAELGVIYKSSNLDVLIARAQQSQDKIKALNFSQRVSSPVLPFSPTGLTSKELFTE